MCLTSCNLTGSALKVQPGQRDFCLDTGLQSFMLWPHLQCIYTYSHIYLRKRESANCCFWLYFDLYSTINYNIPQWWHQQKQTTTLACCPSALTVYIRYMYVWRLFSSLWACWGALDLLFQTPQQSREGKHQENQNQAPLIFLLFQYL